MKEGVYWAPKSIAFPNIITNNKPASAHCMGSHPLNGQAALSSNCEEKITQSNPQNQLTDCLGASHSVLFFFQKNQLIDHSRARGHRYTYGQFMWMYDKSNQYCKAMINQLKRNNCLISYWKKAPWLRLWDGIFSCILQKLPRRPDRFLDILCCMQTIDAVLAGCSLKRKA